jgi:hypothetical protein
MISVNNNIQSAVNSFLTSKADEVIENVNLSNKEQQQNTVQNDSQITLSTRGERLVALNQDFNIISPNFTITDDFLTRLAELDFISQGQLNNLQQEVDVNNTSDSDSNSSLATIKQNTNDIIERFKNEEQAENLVTTLKKATSIIDSFGKTGSSDIFTTIAQLEHHLKNSDGVRLTDKEKTTLNELQTVLSIAEKLNPQSRTSTNIDKYMQQLEQFS